MEQRGFSLIEVLLAIATLSLIVTGLAAAWLEGQQAIVGGGQQGRAALRLDEAHEAIRNIAEENFASLSDGTYGLVQSGGVWALSGSSDSEDGFTRQVAVSTVDADRKDVTVTVSWQATPFRAGSLSAQSRYTDWHEPVGPGGGGGTRSGMLAYADFGGDDDIVRYELLDTSGTWAAPAAFDVGAPGNRNTRVVELYSSPTRNEKVLVTKHGLNGAGDDNYIYAQVWDGSAWGNQVLLASWPTLDANAQARDFDGAYLDNGDFMVVYEDANDAAPNTPKVRTWNGTTWSAQSNAVDVGGNPAWIALRSRPGTNEAMLVVLDAGNDTNAVLWNGASWVSLTELATNSPGSQYETISFVWNDSVTDVGVLTYNEAADSLPNVRVFLRSVGLNGTWGPDVENVDVGAVSRAAQLVHRPGTSELLGCFKDGANDVNCLEASLVPLWTSLTCAADCAVPGEVADSTDSGAQRSFGQAYEQQSSDLALLMYAQTAANIPRYRTFDPATNQWSAESTLPSIGNNLQLPILVADPLSDEIMAVMIAGGSSVWTIEWNGDTNAFFALGGRGQTEHSTTGTVGDFRADFAWDLI